MADAPTEPRPERDEHGRVWPVEHQVVEGDREGPSAWLQYALFRAAVGAFAHLPAFVRRGLSWSVGRLAMALDRKRSRYAAEFIAQALPKSTARERQALVLAAWRHLIEFTLEDVRFNSVVVGPRLREHFELDFSDDVKRLIEQGGGALAITPHVGAWEALPALWASLHSGPVYVVARPPRNRPLSKFIQASREARGFRVLHRHGAVESLSRVVQAGGVVGLLLDQRARGKTLLAPFFGRPAHCERSIPLIARRLRRPLLFVSCYRTARPFHYRVVASKVLWPEEAARMSPEELLLEINRQMERMILAAPEQYFWLHERYRNAPQPAAPSGAT